ncbi:MAG: flavodoxin-dependent (E)-4-hydroxy-3-methylbut-2-enyl-diphosphate synthase, partial [Lachnospiraceae bacterium]|nr:flavodoxin-dependent (E)-4-hydroxy-3-methylbut-2-enyl-diphosphate synthase [Lachnospiraceae bacterium]
MKALHRDNTKVIKIGDVLIGGGNPIAIQSMTNTDTADVDKTVEQILRLEEAGCQIVRATANTMESAVAFSKIKERIHIPLVADIHFDYKLAIAAMDHGADKIRINPGNIGGEENLKKVVERAKIDNIPI